MKERKAVILYLELFIHLAFSPFRTVSPFRVTVTLLRYTTQVYFSGNSAQSTFPDKKEPPRSIGDGSFCFSLPGFFATRPYIVANHEHPGLQCHERIIPKASEF